jgi:hypothetical protein
MSYFKEEHFDNRGGVGESGAVQVVYHLGEERYVAPQVAYTMINTNEINNISRICWDSIQGFRVSAGIFYAIDYDAYYHDFFEQRYGLLYDPTKNYIVVQNIHTPPIIGETELDYLRRSTIGVYQLEMFN